VKSYRLGANCTGAGYRSLDFSPSRPGPTVPHEYGRRLSRTVNQGLITIIAALCMVIERAGAGNSGRATASHFVG
jgi:hypothetical protein